MLIFDFKSIQIMNVHDKYVYAFGRVLWSFSDFEYHYKSVLVQAKILNVEKSMIITKELTFNKLIELTNDLLKNEFGKDEDKIKEIEELFVNAKKVNQQRNEIMHSHWLGSSASETMHKYNIKKSKVEEFTPEQINEVADYIVEVDKKLVSFIRKHFEPAFR